MRNVFKRLERICQQSKQRKEYTRLRLDALAAEKSGDVTKSIALNARADRMMDQVIYS